MRRARRIDEIARLLTDTLVQEGFRSARVTPHVDPHGRRDATLRFEIAAGAQARIVRASITGVPDEAEWRDAARPAARADLERVPTYGGA